MKEKEDVSPAPTPSINEGQMEAEKQMRDIGADLYLEVQQYSREELEAESKAVLRKIDWVIMPLVRTRHACQVSKQQQQLLTIQTRYA
jgi:hypothetical protein